MQQSRNSEINVDFLHLCGLLSTYGSPAVIFAASSNIKIQITHPMSSKEIFGGSQSDAYAFSCMISSHFITIACETQQAGNVSHKMVAFDRFDGTQNILVEQVGYQPNKPCFDVSSMLCASVVQDVVLLSQFCSDLCVLCSKDLQTLRTRFVFCSNLDFPVSILN